MGAAETPEAPVDERDDQVPSEILQAPEDSAAVFQVQMVPIDSIIVLEPLRRPINVGNVYRLAKSIERDGLKMPIDVVLIRSGMYRGRYQVIAGAHRLAACEKLGMKEIMVRILKREEAIAWEEAENIFRHLPALDESIALVNYAQKHRLEVNSSANNRQPHDRGFSRVAEALGYDRKRVTEAYAHGALSEPIRERIRALGLDDNRKVLTQLSKMTSLSEQERFLDGKGSPPLRVKKGKGEVTNTNATAMRNSLHFLCAVWKKSAVKKLYDEQSDEIRQQFRNSLT
jgi:ParB-like chromosome segregation protein Spo0J